MREIKFRAWDKECNKMIEIVGFINFNNTSVRIWYIGDDEIIYNESFSIDRIDIIQYTGLKDFCESDIHYLKLNGIETHIEYVNAVIDYTDVECAFFYRILGDSDYKRLSLIDKNILTIEPKGNIYQNADLLTV